MLEFGDRTASLAADPSAYPRLHAAAGGSVEHVFLGGAEPEEDRGAAQQPVTGERQRPFEYRPTPPKSPHHPANVAGVQKAAAPVGSTSGPLDPAPRLGEAALESKRPHHPRESQVLRPDGRHARPPAPEPHLQPAHRGHSHAHEGELSRIGVTPMETRNLHRGGSAETRLIQAIRDYVGEALGTHTAALMRQNVIER